MSKKKSDPDKKGHRVVSMPGGVGGTGPVGSQPGGNGGGGTIASTMPEKVMDELGEDGKPVRPPKPGGPLN